LKLIGAEGVWDDLVLGRGHASGPAATSGRIVPNRLRREDFPGAE